MSVAPDELAALLDCGGSMKYVRVHGMTPLLYCCAAYDEEVAVRLLHEGVEVDMDAPDNSGFTPLHYAADAGLGTLAKALLAADCATRRWTDDMPSPFGSSVPGGKTALHLAAARGDVTMIEMLVEHDRLLVDVLDADGNTPYILGCMYGHEEPRLIPTGGAPHVCEQALQSKRLADQAAANERLADLGRPRGRLLEVHTESKLWSVAECKHILGVLKRVVPGKGGWQNSRHTAHATTDLPAADLPSAEYQQLFDQVQQRVFPRLMHHYGYHPADGWVYTFRDLFFVKYEARDGEQSGLALHADGSLLSFNLLLNPIEEFTGGGTFFELTGTTHTIAQGDALFHCGRLRHAGAPITTGTRMLLVGFVDVRRAADCGS